MWALAVDKVPVINKGKTFQSVANVLSSPWQEIPKYHVWVFQTQKAPLLSVASQW